MEEKAEAEETPIRDSEQIGKAFLPFRIPDSFFFHSFNSSPPFLQKLKLVSDDDEIDYSAKPEFYDPKIDEKNETWARKQRGGRASDAVLSCPACFTTLCMDSQRYVLTLATII